MILSSCNLPQKSQRRNQSGFTLLEIMIVVLIIGVLLNIAAPAFIHVRDSGQARSCVSNLRTITLAKEEFAIENNAAATYTPVWSDLSAYVKRNQTPLCPTNNVAYQLNDLKSLPVCPYGGAIGGTPHQISQ